MYKDCLTPNLEILIRHEKHGGTIPNCFSCSLASDYYTANSTVSVEKWLPRKLELKTKITRGRSGVV